MQNLSRYLPDPGGDLLVYAGRTRLGIVLANAAGVRQVLLLGRHASNATAFLARLDDGLGAYRPDRIVLSRSVTTASADEFVHRIRALAQDKGVALIEIPDVRELNRALRRRLRPRGGTRDGIARPPAPPAPAPAADPAPLRPGEHHHDERSHLAYAHPSFAAALAL